MQCDASKYELFVEVPPKFQGVVDLKDHFGDDASEVIGLLLAEGCRAVVRDAKRARNGRAAVWQGDGFSFRNFLLNTAEVASRVGASPAEIVNCIKAGVLTGCSTPNDYFYLVVRDKKLDALTHIRAISAKVPMKRSVKGKGLTKIILAIADLAGFPSSDFCVEDLKSALESEADWKSGRDYEENSLGLVILKLEKEGRLIRIVDAARDLNSRRWSFVTASKVKPKSTSAPVVSAPVVSSVVAPSPATVGVKKDQMVEALAGELADQVRQRARELLGL